MIESKPECFPTYRLFAEWRDYARIAKDPCTVCEDCTPNFQYEMTKLNLCSKSKWEQQIFMERA